MRGPGLPTIDQLLVLLAVAEEGSFTAAARRLGRATSAISYAIDGRQYIALTAGNVLYSFTLPE